MCVGMCGGGMWGMCVCGGMCVGVCRWCVCGCVWCACGGVWVWVEVVCVWMWRVWGRVCRRLGLGAGLLGSLWDWTVSLIPPCLCPGCALALECHLP